MRSTLKTIFGSFLTGPFKALFVLCFAGLLLGCAGETSASDPPNLSLNSTVNPRRSNVLPPSITLLPADVQLSVGQSVIFTARPQGGEAILFAVDWSIREDAAGGTIASTGVRNADGTYSATYTAPKAAAGSFTVEAKIREFPSAFALATVRVRTSK